MEDNKKYEYLKGNKYALGHKHSEETKKRIGLSSKGIKRKPFTEEHKKNLSKSNPKCWLGRKHTEEEKRKIGLGNKGKIISEEHKRKLAENNKKRIYSEETRKKLSKIWLNRKHSEETKRQMRISAINYIKEKKGSVSPTIGRHEKEILDKLQSIIKFLIRRNFYINGYFLDGYCKELNLAIEIDENRHYVNGILKEKDIKRQKNIENALSCKFLRIKERDFLNNKIVFRKENFLHE